MDKRKVKHLVGAKRASGDQQQGGGAELVTEEELRPLANVKVEIVSMCI